jgi:hypothetical protein
MNEVYPLVPLGELLIKSEEWIDINPTEKYKQVTVKIWGKGVVERNEVNGAEIAATKRLKVNSEQFILSRIDARHGAFGLIPNCLDGAVVTNDFPVFTPNNQKIVPQFLDWMSKTKDFIELLAYCNSPVFWVCLKDINPSANNSARYILKTPVILPDEDTLKYISLKTQELLVEIKQANKQVLCEILQQEIIDSIMKYVHKQVSHKLVDTSVINLLS